MIARIAQQDDAHRLATRDREATADHIIDAACKEAVRAFRLRRTLNRGDVDRNFRFWLAERHLRAAGLSVTRILGGAR